MKLKKMNYILSVMMFLMCLTSTAWSQSEHQPSSADEDSLVQLEQAVESAKKNLDLLEKDLDAEKNFYEEELRQQKIYRTQMNSLRNFLIVPEIRISVLEKGIGEVDISFSLIQSRVQKIKERENNAGRNFSLVKEKILLIDQRIRELTLSKGDTISRQPVIKALKAYRAVKGKQQGILLNITELLTSEININNDLSNAFQEIKVTLRKEIKDKKGEGLFQRNEFELKTFFSQTFTKEIPLSFLAARQLFSPKQLSWKWSLFKENMTHKIAMIIAGFIMIGLFCFKGFSLLRKEKFYKDLISKRAGYPLIILERSLLLIFCILLTMAISKTQIYLVFPDGFKFLISLLTIILMTRISSDAIRLIAREKGPVFFDALFRWRNSFVYGIRSYAFVYLFIYRFLSMDPLFLVSIRVLSEALLVAGVVFFWKAYRKSATPSSRMGMKLLNIWTKAIVILGLIADIAGYGSFAAFWYVSWGISIVVACVCIMLIYSIKDIDRKLKKKISPESQTSSGLFNPVYWLLSNGVYFFIIIFGITGIAFAWGVHDAAFGWFVEMFNKKYTMGKIELSIAGLVYSILVLLLTHLFTRIWRGLIAKHGLRESGLSTGAKEAVITISVYLIWSAGILVSLNVFGLNTTSITVAFGALSIGLGFGLQNIANNFVSGLILLFERPIQVGDVVEVGGLWGEVKKINVRSTLVQTYTNSSLIIPNSEFISATVTNWSHQDPNIRRDLTVGVAYGSDTQLVKKLLIQAANLVPGVDLYLKKPVVQFLNFGDSSLDFRLRFWSIIDDFVETESNLRFEIDRLFREHNVVIPFPQRDLHIIEACAK